MVDHMIDLILDRRMLELFLVAPTGAGKSTILSALLTRLAGQKKHRAGIGAVIVAVPQNHIAASFGGNAFVFSGCGHIAAPDLWQSKKLSTAEVRARVKSKDPLNFAAVTTHAALTRALVDSNTNRVLLPKDCKHLLFVVDEGHHAPTEISDGLLGKTTRIAVQRGATVLRVTATPVRNDQKVVVEPGYLGVVSRSIAEHAQPDVDGKRYMPRHIRLLHTPLADYKVTTTRQLDGEDAPEKYNCRAVQTLVKRWREDGCPKTVVIVPAAKVGGSAKKWAEDVQKAFSKVKIGSRKARVHDAVGTGAGARNDLTALLDREKDVTNYQDSAVDVIIACKRFDEGTDWPLCSHVYVVGFPRNMPLAIQRWGRSARSKEHVKGHPCPDEAVCTWFVPVIDVEGMKKAGMADESASTEDLRSAQIDASLLIACFLHNHAVGSEFLENPGAIAAKYGRSDKESESLRRDVSALHLQNDLELAEARKRLVEIGREVRAEIGDCTPDDMLAVIEDTADENGWTERDMGNVLYLAVKDLARDNPEYAGQLENMAGEYLAKAVKKLRRKSSSSGISQSTNLIKECYRAQWDTLVEDFDHLVVRNDVLETCKTASGFAGYGEDIEGFTRAAEERLESKTRAYRTDRTLEECDQAILTYHAEHGKRPTQTTDKEFNSWDAWLIRNHQSSLSRRCTELGLK
jgi:superfamily II DNA or RNA helicase